MNMTLHLTDACNLRCRYCYQTRSPERMTEETARKAIDLSRSGGEGVLAKGDTAHTGVCFFGGEPLLMRGLIEDTVAYANEIHEKTGHAFFFRLVTNGILLDESFLEFAAKNRIGLGFSHDGLMQDDARIFPDGTGTAAILEEKIPLLLKYLPDTMVMCTVYPASVGKFADSVEWLFAKGFRKIYTIPMLGAAADWTDERILELDRQYGKISDLYVKWTREGTDFDFPVFDNKIASHILGDAYRHRTCRFGIRQVSVAPDGGIYPCIQFVGDPLSRMGSVDEGIFHGSVPRAVLEERNEPDTCLLCTLKSRCKYNCRCQNKQMSGSPDRVSPFTCAHEKMLIKYADRAADRLFEEKNETFIRKQYTARLERDCPEFFADE